jgi:hypothetical protein
LEKMEKRWNSIYWWRSVNWKIKYFYF